MFWKAASAGPGTHLHMNAQLIDTRTDTHVWAEQYDRDLNDLFAVQSEIAQKVAEQLNAKVTSAEKLAIDENRLPISSPSSSIRAPKIYINTRRAPAPRVWGRQSIC